MIPAGITGAELDKGAKAELRSLPRSLADLVAQHLVASGQLLDVDPELAYQHAKTARRLAARLGGVREAVAITAYLAEHYDEALTEFRAVRRMTGNHEVLPMMADCERALGRPEKALALSREKQVVLLEEGSQMEMLIVAAGARRDMGQTAAAIQTLEVPELTKRTRAEWLPRLRYAYADALAEAGRTEDALVWFHRAAGVDQDGSTGAAERAAELEGLQFTDLDDEDEFDSDDDLKPDELVENDSVDDQNDSVDDEDDEFVDEVEDDAETAEDELVEDVDDEPLTEEAEVTDDVDDDEAEPVTDNVEDDEADVDDDEADGTDDVEDDEAGDVEVGEAEDDEADVVEGVVKDDEKD
ncbi:tetratricopeptide repeat protein [Kribbella monticola]|uniref:hypothetical protein n=1 Tax=Kribbella monticola TaxID=2185285 RepID=UPI001E349485|nr:hypothetical protein [Kribbella monticola]